MVRRPRPRFTRRRVRLWLGAVLILAVGAVGVQLVRSQWVQYLRRLGAGEVIGLLPEVAQRIENFRRVKMEGDRMTWEVAAREAQYFEQEDAIVVQEPQVSFHLEDGDGVVSLNGATGRIVLHGREMDRAELDGGIEVRFRDYLVRTDSAVYDRAQGTVVAPSAVSVTSDGLVLTGDRMIVEMDTERVRFEGAVDTILRRPAQEDGADAGEL